jgi:PAS domain S-box-containing protein
LFQRRFRHIGEDFFGRAANPALKETIRHCLENPGSTHASDLPIVAGEDATPRIRWEFSACPGEQGAAENIRAIGYIAEAVAENRAGAADSTEQGFHGAERSELFYHNLFANSLDGVLLCDEKGLITFASPSITPILGYSTDEITGTNTFDYAHPEDRALAVSAFLDEVGNAPKIKFISIRLLKKSGDWLWCIVRGHNLVQTPSVQGIVIYFYDDTLRKQTETALIQNKKRFREQATILNNVTDVIVTTDMNRVVTSWNKVIEKLSGISENEAIGKPYRDILPTDYRPFTNDQVSEIVFKEGIWRGEVSFPDKYGEKAYLLHTISMLRNEEGSPIGLLGVGKHITERKAAEARLAASEQFYRSLSHYSLDGILMSDINGKITYCGPSVQRISGYEPAQLLGQDFFEFIHPEDVAIARDAFGKEINKEPGVKFVFLRLKYAGGQWIWCTVRSHNLLGTPEFNALVIYFTNDTKRKEAEDRLRRSETEFRNLIENLRQGVVVHNNKGELVICNKAAQEILALSEQQLLGATSNEKRWKVIHEDGREFPGHTHPAFVALRTKKSVRDVIMGVIRPLTGERVWLLVNADPNLDENGDVINVIISFTDISEQKRLSTELMEQELHKQKHLTQATIDGQEKERLEIGKELHDNINQHLTTTRLYLEVAREKATGEVLEMINHSHKTLVEIINQIRLLSQSLVPPTLGDLGLTESIQELCDSLKRTHQFNIDFFSRHFSEEQLPDNLKLMLFRITQEQINNIIRHAQAANVEIRLQSDAEYINLTISDDGRGFDPANYMKGLGFSNMTNRANLFDGKVRIDSAPGKGCTLSVIIPLTEEPVNGTN